MPRTRLSTGVIAASLAVASLLVSGGCASQTTTVLPAAPAATSPTLSPAPSSSGLPTQQQLDTAADAVSRLARTYQNSFAGLAVDVPKGRLVVYRKPGTGFDAALAHLALGVPTDLENAPRSISELATVRGRVEALMGHTSGYSIMSVGDGSVVSFTQGVVEVEVSGDLAKAKRDLGARFGNQITVSAAQPLAG